MPVFKTMKSVPVDLLAAEGLFAHDLDALTPFQRAAANRFMITVQLEHESYMTYHPEVSAMLELLVSYWVNQRKVKCDFLKDAAHYFLRPGEDLEEDIRARLNIGPDADFHSVNEPYIVMDDEILVNDLLQLKMEYNPSPAWSQVPSVPTTPNTESSSFLSFVTSATTLPTPEPVRTPEPTLSEYCFKFFICAAFDKAVYAQVTKDLLLYDTFYVELAKAVETAMEIPVVQIKEDIVNMFFEAYQAFEAIILEKEEIAKAIAWENRMRKKQKRTLRRLDNFKGYESPPSSRDSTISSHPSYKIPPPRPCSCVPHGRYNRYAKDRFGIYLPRERKFTDQNTTVTPALSIEEDSSTTEVAADAEDDRMSMASKRTTQTQMSYKSTKSRYSQNKAAIEQFTN